MKKELLSFHNDPKIKEKYLARVREHRACDEIVKGTYWEDGKGCAVGCTIHSGRHEDYETELGIPSQLARIEDGIFESLPNELALEWPEKFLQSIPVGVNLMAVYWKFMEWLLIDEKEGVIRFAKTDVQKLIIRDSGNIFTRLLRGESPSYDECTEVRKHAAAAAYAAAAAAYAAAAAAYAAADAADADAAAAAYADAAAAAAYAAADAADAAAAAYADADARLKTRIRQSEKLLELFRESK